MVVVAVRYEPVFPKKQNQNQYQGKIQGKNANIEENYRQDCQNPSIHRGFWPKTMKMITGKNNFNNREALQNNREKIFISPIRAESRNDAQSTLGMLKFPHHPAPGLTLKRS